MLCNFEHHPQGIQCQKCGRFVEGTDDVNTFANCKEIKLGDAVTRILRKCGITKERYLRAKAFLGSIPECNCERREQWLNKFNAPEWIKKIAK